MAHLKPSTCTYENTNKIKEDYTIVCTQCKRVQVPALVPRPSISIRLSKEDDGNWVNADDLSGSQPTSCLSHGLCRTCFNSMDADLTMSPLSLGPPRTTRNVLSKSLSSPLLTRPVPPPPTPPHVLIVDDNKLQRQIHKRMVEQEGCACDIAVSGASAVELAKKGNYRLVLMDLVMSPMDGWSTTKLIRAIPSPSLSSSLSPRIVAVTGLPVDEKLREACREAGMDDVVQKPVSPAVLSKILWKHSPPLVDR